MKQSKPKDWGRIILPAFLLIISIQGVMRLPAVRVRFFSEEILQERLRLVTRGYGYLGESLVTFEAGLAEINYPSGPGFSPDMNYNSNERTRDFFQMLLNVWYSMSAPTAQYSFERNHYLARKKFFHMEMRLYNLKLMLDNLLFSTNYHRIDGSASCGKHDSNLIQKQIQVCRQEYLQYENKLKIQAKRLEQIREYADKQIDQPDKGFSTKN